MTRHRAWELLKAIAYYAAAWVLVVGGALLIGGCATSKEIELTQRVRDLEVNLAGAQDDNAMLMKYIVEQEVYIRELQGGMEIQARQMARARENCSL